jgi:hypothetical protein
MVRILWSEEKIGFIGYFHIAPCARAMELSLNQYLLAS